MPTWATYRRALAPRLGLHVLSTTTAAGSTTTAMTLGDLADTTLGAKHYDGTWALFVSTGSTNTGGVRRVANDGFTPATGALTVSRAWSSNVSSGTAIELMSPLPPISAGGERGLRDIANEALRECWAIDTLSITPATSTTLSHGLSTLPWPVQEAHVIDVWTRTSGASTDSLVADWEFEHDMDAPAIRLKHTLSTSDALKPRLYRPLDTWIYSAASSAWANSTVGLVNDSDEALLPVNGMLRVGLAIAYEHLANSGSRENQAYYEAQAAKWRQRADAWKAHHLPRLPRRQSHRVSLTNRAGGMEITGTIG